MTSMVGRTAVRDAESIDVRTETSFGGSSKGSVRGLRFANSTARAKDHARRVHIQKRGFFYDAAFAHTMMRGLVAAPLGQVTVLSLIKVTGLLRGPQYPMTSTSSWLHSPLHAAAVQSRRITRIAFSAGPGGPAGPGSPF